MASKPETTVNNPTVTPAKPPILCGAPTSTREIADTEHTLFEEFRDIIEPQIRKQFNVPADFALKPTKIRTQVVAGTNYFFHVPLPSGKFAHVRLFKPLACNAAKVELKSGADGATPVDNRSSLVTVESEEKNE